MCRVLAWRALLSLSYISVKNISSTTEQKNIWSSRQLGRTLVTIVKWLWETSDQVTGHKTVSVRPVEKSFKILNFGELSGAPYSGSNNHSGGGGSDTESEHNVKSLMELQQQGMPGYGLYRSHYDNPNAGFGNGRHLGGYPFPPMPGQNYSGYPHLGYPSSQSPGPREGKYFCIPESNNFQVIRNINSWRRRLKTRVHNIRISPLSQSEPLIWK